MNQSEATEFLKDYQFLAALRTTLPTKLRSDEIDRYLADLLRDGSFTSEELEEARRAREALGDEVDTIRHLANQLIGMLSADLRTQLQDIPVGTLPDLILNAETVRSPTGDPIVVVASGLSTMLFEVAAWCAGATEMEGAPAETDIGDTTRNIFQWTVFYVTRFKEWMPRDVFRSRFPSRRNLIGGLWANALNFVLGHEYGHAILGHLDHAKTNAVNISSIGAAPLLAYDFSRKMEFEADAKGIEIALAFSKAVHNGWIGAGASGAEIALQLLRLIEELFPRKGARSTHPAAVDRLNAFHAILRHAYGDEILDDLHQLGAYFDMTAAIGKRILNESPL